MARLPDDEIKRIKREVSLLGLVAHQGYEITTQGKDSVVHCPFHEDKTPSCVISPKTNLYHCFGCGAGGSVIDWVMKTENLGFREAVIRLGSEEVTSESSSSSSSKSSTASKSAKSAPSLAADPTQSLTDTERQTHLRQTVEYYHETLMESSEALDYLSSRGLSDPDLIRTFKLGYANRSFAARLPTRKSKAGNVLRDQLQTVGILRESGHEHFNGSLVVPIIDDRYYTEGRSQRPTSRDISTSVCGIYGRKLLGNQLRKGTPQHLYLPGPHRGVWNAAGLRDQSEVILCEALIDAMTFWVNGFRNVTASYGAQGFTEDHLAVLKRSGVKKILIAYDADEAGNTAAEKLAKQLGKEGLACYRVVFPKGMDANAYALQVTPANRSLGLVIQQAQFMKNMENIEHVEEVESIEIDALPEASPVETSSVLEPSPTKPSNQEPLNTQHREDPELRFSFSDRQYRVRGLSKNNALDSLKVNILASNTVDGLHVDTFDLYAAKARQVFIKNAALEFGVEESVVKRDLAKVLLRLEDLQAEALADAAKKEGADPSQVLSEEEEAAALELLRSPDLLDRILSDLGRCGVVGEDVNKLVGYLAASSRKLEKPLAVVIQSTSAAGKSSLMEAILQLMPETERVHYSAMTGQSLFYMGETNLKHKILAIAEEEGASSASYALKLLQSEGEITIASTGKDDETGNLMTKEYKVEGPVMLFLTTTAIDIDEELMNRCLVLTVNESREQTRLIHAAQRQKRTLDGLHAKLEKESLMSLHRNAQSLLKPLAVINPYADQLTFVDDKTRTRRDHEKYLTLIDSIALLHQHQRSIKTITHDDHILEYIEVQLSDIETANRLAHDVLGRTLDELPSQTRKLLTLVQKMVSAECQAQDVEQKEYRFSRRELRDRIRWSDTALKVHLARLVELEYLLVHRGRGGRFDYELLFDAVVDDVNGSESHLMGLIDTKHIKQIKQIKQIQQTKQKKQKKTDRSGSQKHRSGAGQGSVNGRSVATTSLHPLPGVVSTESGQVQAETI